MSDSCKGGPRRSSASAAANRERVFELLERRAGPGGITRLSIEEIADALAIPPLTVRRHIRNLVAEQRIVRAVGLIAGNVESDDERALRRAMGAANPPRFQTSMTAIVGNEAAVRAVRSEQDRLARRGKRRAAQRAARANI